MKTDREISISWYDLVLDEAMRNVTLELDNLEAETCGMQCSLGKPRS